VPKPLVPLLNEIVTLFGQNDDELKRAMQLEVFIVLFVKLSASDFDNGAVYRRTDTEDFPIDLETDTAISPQERDDNIIDDNLVVN
jgi:hypothetical protein